MHAKQLFREMLQKFGIAITRTETFERLVRYEEDARDLAILSTLTAAELPFYMKHRKLSNSQLRQDLFALSVTGFKHGGFFVEFGAADGVRLSNTYLCETAFGWKGILAEPARSWHANLLKNRKVSIDTRCVWTESGSHLQFTEADNAELSTITAFSKSDAHREARKRSREYTVDTVKLNDLLMEHDAPANIDYLSIDTEGSEFKILETIDFKRYSFGVITCEHNHAENRRNVFDLLSARGYRRVFEEFSSFDDWYVNAASPYLERLK